MIKSDAEETDGLKLRGVLDGMAEAFGLLAPDFTILEHNREALRLDGRRREDVVGRSHWEVYPGSEDAELGQLLKKAMSQRVTVSLEHQYAWADGRALWLEMRAYPNDDGSLAVFWRDVTDRRQADQALRQSEERFRALAEQTEVGVAMADRDGRLIWVNDRLAEMAGRKPDEVTRLTVRDFTPPGEWPENDRLFRRMIEEGEPFVIEKPLGPPAQVTGWNRLSVSPRRDAEGHIVGGIAVAVDITERRLAEIALRESEEQLRLIVESARDYAIFTMDADRRVTQWMPGAEAVFGWTRQEIEGRSADILFTPEDRDKGAPQWEAETALREGKAPDVRWHLRKDGRRVFIEGEVVPLVNDRHHGGFLKIGQDVTSRRAGQEALRESEERLRQFGEASQDVLWSRHPETLQWTYLTSAFETIYGLSRDDALRGDNFGNWMGMILPDDRDTAAASVEKVRQGERVTFEYRIRRPLNGEIRWLRDTSFPIFDDTGELIRIGGIGQDITDDKDAAERMMVLVAELQHRTRNLMGVVRATAKRTGETSTDYPGFRKRFGERLEALARVQGLLSRLGDTDRVAFDELITTEVKAMHGSIDRVTLSGPTGIRLRSSMVQTLAMALHELATNSVKYGALGQPTGHLAVTWEMAKPDRRGRPRLHIDWLETGVTMPLAGAKAQGGGQGRELIERALPYQLKAQTSFDLGPDGVHCTITIPVSQSNEAGQENG
ncbi:PAS domain S-box protein [Rhizobium wenxiniae]|uniref:PAS domain S-box protein n=1 Tax=Rhizobium wenxiniae TaxID=1737357 RepID=UPI001C6E8A25|nr:PAS domain S-box protein [Rhizobium wenxiniae]